MRQLLIKEPQVDMELAQAIWAFGGRSFAPVVQARIQAAFDAELRRVTWQTAAPEINAWASLKTHKMVTRVVEPRDFDPSTVFALSNAMYFKGIWTNKFDSEQTRPMPFIRRDGTTRSVKMMHASMPVARFATPEFQGIRLPYSSGRFQLYAFLPAHNQTPVSILPRLSLFQNAWRQAIRPIQTELYFPKLTLDLSCMELLPVLGKLSMLGKNDLAPMSADGGRGALRIAKVIHKTKLELDEAGTRAAAVTVVAVTKGLGAGPPPVVFNRPFVLCLADEKSQVTLFTGIVHDPV